MNGSIIVFRALAKNWFRSKSGVFFSFMFPAMLLLIFGTVFGNTGGGGGFSLHVQNLDLEDGQPTELSRTLVEVLESSGAFWVTEISPDENIDTYVGEGSFFDGSYSILVIPENFEQEAMDKIVEVRTGVVLDTLDFFIENYGHTMPADQLELLENGRDVMSAWQDMFSADTADLLLLMDNASDSSDAVRGLLSSVITIFNSQMVGSGTTIEITSDDLAQKQFKPVDYYLPGYIAAFIMTNGIMGVTTNISEFRRNGVIKRLAATPLGKTSWIVGNLLHQTLLAFMLTLLMIALGWVVFGVQAIPDVYALSLIFLGSIVFCSMGIVLGGVIKDVEAANAAGSAIGFPMMFLSGAFWPLMAMPAFMQTIAKVMPLYYFHDGLREIMINRNPVEAAPAFLLLGVLAVVFVLLAVRVTKWKEF